MLCREISPPELAESPPDSREEDICGSPFVAYSDDFRAR